MTMNKMSVIAEPGKQNIVMTRTFNAPRELVYKAYTDPALIPQWWGPGRYTTVVDKMDVKFGGVWRYVQRSSDGEEYGFKGVYHHIVPNEQIVSTIEFEGVPGHVGLETVTFEERDGETTITDLAVFQTVEDRDGMLNSGMEEGANELWDRFEELLGQLQAA
jgi:uncharacterized protein YndB with AHSA1/START domain